MLGTGSSAEGRPPVAADTSVLAIPAGALLRAGAGPGGRASRAWSRARRAECQLGSTRLLWLRSLLPRDGPGSGGCCLGGFGCGGGLGLGGLGRARSGNGSGPFDGSGRARISAAGLLCLSVELLLDGHDHRPLVGSRAVTGSEPAPVDVAAASTNDGGSRVAFHSSCVPSISSMVALSPLSRPRPALAASAARRLCSAPCPLVVSSSPTSSFTRFAGTLANHAASNDTEVGSMPGGARVCVARRAANGRGPQSLEQLPSIALWVA